MTDSEQPEQGNGERATVALVNAKVATVDAKLDGLRDLTNSGFEDIRRELSALDAISKRQDMQEAKVDGINDRLLITEGRVATIEGRHAYSIRDLPNILIGLGVLALAAVQFIHG